MKRFHVHMAVDDLENSVNFYSALFGVEPTKRKTDYAKWMLEDPRLNFAISARGAKPGVDHFGFQVDSAGELDALRDQLKQANLQPLNTGATTCCYAVSEKSWVRDPGGIAWETYHTMEDAEFFNETLDQRENACCTPDGQAAASHDPAGTFLELPVLGSVKAGCC